MRFYFLFSVCFILVLVSPVQVFAAGSESSQPTTASKAVVDDFDAAFDDEFDERIRCQTINAVGIALLAKRGMFEQDVDELRSAEIGPIQIG